MKTTENEDWKPFSRDTRTTRTILSRDTYSPPSLGGQLTKRIIEPLSLVALVLRAVVS